MKGLRVAGSGITCLVVKGSEDYEVSKESIVIKVTQQNCD